ncbi:MAG TPA: FAD-dependent oxidoreductase [Kofleriaceae bacterium]|nr:FAD-dependent oxidoreductase [Kofleriaceae bacterium]
MKQVILVGGGHAHIEVVRRFGRLPASQRSSVAVTLLDGNRYAAYSGMLPGLIAGHYQFAETHVDLAALCERNAVSFCQTRAAGVLLSDQQVVQADRQRRRYDVLSLDVGAASRTVGIAGVEQHAIAIKPVAAFLRRWHAYAATAPRNCPLVVLGGGAAGVEVALALAFRLRAQKPWITLLAATLLPGYSSTAVARVRACLAARGVNVLLDRATAVDAHSVQTAAGALASEFTVVATGASAPTWIAASGLATDAGGFVAVGPTLQSRSHANVFASGDIAAQMMADGRAVPKSGVYAVRAGPVLFANLMAAALEQGSMQSFEPPAQTLALLASGNKHATLCYGNVAISGAWAWHLKNRIDRRFMAKYV